MNSKMKAFLTILIFTGMGLIFINAGTTDRVLSPPEKHYSAGIDSTKGIDPETGLVNGPGIDMVKAQCTACHSSKLITQFRANREGWTEKIRWMQKKQKLWDLGETEPIILDYLTRYYGPGVNLQNARRTPLKDIKWYKLEK